MRRGLRPVPVVEGLRAQASRQRAADSRALLHGWLPKFPHIAQAPTSPEARPHEWEGGRGHCSVVIQRGTRVWVFQTTEQRDRFLTQVPGAQALANIP